MATYRPFDDLLSTSAARIADLLHQTTEEDCVCYGSAGNGNSSLVS